MRLTNASDAISWKSCRRRAWYDLREVQPRQPPDAFAQLLMHDGIEHERAVLSSIGPYTEARDEHHTAELMAARTAVIYQPIFRNESLGVVAQPDFLLLESEGYRAADAKLSTSLKKKIDLRIQLAVYQKVLDTDLLTKALLGNGTEAYIQPKDLDLAGEFLTDMQQLAQANRPSAHYGRTKCEACPYSDTCVPEFKAEQDLGLNSFIKSPSIPHLQALGLVTLVELAEADPNAIPDGPSFKGDTIPNAVTHAKSLLTRKPILLSESQRFAGTPIHFDIETNPRATESSNEVYLWGFLMPPYDKNDFEYVWHDGGLEADRKGWRQFLEKVADHRARYTDAVYVHYGDFERQHIKRCAAKFGDDEHSVVDWLLNGGGLLDLLVIVKESVILPTYGYGLKEVCKDEDLVNFQWELKESGSQWSVVRYIDFLQTRDEVEREEIKAEVLSYNRDDVRATRALEVWLGEVGVLV